MKKVLLDMLICPACLPAEARLRETVRESTGEEILEGKLHCAACDRIYHRKRHRGSQPHPTFQPDAFGKPL